MVPSRKSPGKRRPLDYDDEQAVDDEETIDEFIKKHLEDADTDKKEDSKIGSTGSGSIQNKFSQKEDYDNYSGDSDESMSQEGLTPR